MFQNVTVKQLISMLLDCDLNSFVEVHTDNKDGEDRYHAYAFTGVDKKPTMDGLTGEMYTKIKFHNGDFERDNTGYWLSHEEHCKKIGVTPSGLGSYYWCSNCDCSIDTKEFHRTYYNFCPKCGAKMIESEVK